MLAICINKLVPVLRKHGWSSKPVRTRSVPTGAVNLIYPPLISKTQQ